MSRLLQLFAVIAVVFDFNPAAAENWVVYRPQGGALEVFLAKRRARKAGSNAQAVDGPEGDKRSALSEAQAAREKIERLIGTKTV
jgi:hypothetical protein